MSSSPRLLLPADGTSTKIGISDLSDHARLLAGPIAAGPPNCTPAATRRLAPEAWVDLCAALGRAFGIAEWGAEVVARPQPHPRRKQVDADHPIHERR